MHHYMLGAMRGWRLIAVLALTAIVPAAAAFAQSSDDDLTIMRPEPYEPWRAPKYRSPPDLNKPLPIPSRRIAVPPPRADVPPPIYVPQTGALLPNMPTISGSGPGGRETSQDRAVRCAHQAGSYSALAGDRNAYIGGCINQ